MRVAEACRSPPLGSKTALWYLAEKAMIAEHASVTSSQWSEERAMIFHLILTTLAGEEIQLALELNELSRLDEFEDEAIQQLPKLGGSSTFGCALTFVCRDSQVRLVDPIWQTLRNNYCFNVISQPCFEVAEHKGQVKGDAKAIRVPYSSTDRVIPQAFAHTRGARHVKVDEGIRIVAEEAWRNCQNLQIVHLANTVISLQTRAFQRCYALHTIFVPGRKQFGKQVFFDCCSLIQVGASEDMPNQLAPNAELMPQAFQKCLALQHIDLTKKEYDPNRLTRCLPEQCFLESGLTSLTLPPDFTWIGPAACECCPQLLTVDLSRSAVTEIMGGAFAHCGNLHNVQLPPKLRVIEESAFYKCTSLIEVMVPPTLLYVGSRAFAGCTQLSRFHRVGKSATWRGTYSMISAFQQCDQLPQPQWFRWLPLNWKDEGNESNDYYETYESLRQ